MQKNQLITLGVTLQGNAKLAWQGEGKILHRLAGWCGDGSLVTSGVVQLWQAPHLVGDDYCNIELL